MLYGLARRALFQLDAEEAHELVARNVVRLQRSRGVLRAVRMMYGSPRLEKVLWGLRFHNPVGVAAGFDKNGAMVSMLSALGFGFIEVGTVTLRPQPGNDKPRMFRDPAAGALINRLGFNNEGAPIVAERLRRLWERSENREHLPPVLVNIGKNRDVDAAGAVSSYRETYRVMAPVADGVVVNVSSPNTPGLRDLQRTESLREILMALRAERQKLPPVLRGGSRPIIVKIAPDLADQEVDEISALCREMADGMSATNTTLSRDGWTGEEQAGGMSGAPLLARSNAILSRVRKVVGADFPLIGVGGIFHPRDARQKLAAGADLIQGYTGFVYQGPSFASRIVRELVKSSS